MVSSKCLTSSCADAYVGENGAGNGRSASAISSPFKADCVQHYLIADEPGSKVKFKISTALGTISISYLRSREFGFGSAKCWVDGNERNAKVMHGYWSQPQNIAQ